MEAEQPKVPPPTPVEGRTSAPSDMGKAFEDLRVRFNAMLNEVTGAEPVGAQALAAVRCGGGCHQGVID
jgi:hypothetical protein